MAISWRMLLDEVGDLVLFFLPVPDLIRCRLVCKNWNRLTRSPSFLRLCDVNGRRNAFLFVTHHFRYHDGSSWLDGAHRRRTCFLDVDERRWYLSRLRIPSPNFSRRLTVDAGLIYEISQPLDKRATYKLVLFDLLANTRLELPPVQASDSPPVEVIAVDEGAIKVFLLDRSSVFHLYESTTNAWRTLKNPPERARGLRSLEESAVYFRGNMYAAFDGDESVVVMRYNLEENQWREVYLVKNQNPGDSQLIVHRCRLFFAAWVNCMFNDAMLEIT